MPTVYNEDAQKASVASPMGANTDNQSQPCCFDAGFSHLSPQERTPDAYVEEYAFGLPQRGMQTRQLSPYEGDCNFEKALSANQGSLLNPVYMVKSAGMWMKEARERKTPQKLWDSLWFEGELCCLFADTNVGKTLYAVQMARDIASRGYNVLYLDFELSDKQFEMRYTAEDGNPVEFPINMLRAEMQNNLMGQNIYNTIADIDRVIRLYHSEVIIVDNITWLCNSAESGDMAGHLMAALLEIKRLRGVSILCLAHTPKRALDAPLTQNTLAGSKRIANFMDSVFAIGVDRTNLPSGRYVKQIKVRNDMMRYGEENVIRYEIARSQADGFLGFRFLGFGRERDLITIPMEERGDADTSARAELYGKIEQLIAEGKTNRAIQQELGVSPKTVVKVNRMLQQSQQQQ